MFSYLGIQGVARRAVFRHILKFRAGRLITRLNNLVNLRFSVLRQHWLALLIMILVNFHENSNPRAFL